MVRLPMADSTILGTCNGCMHLLYCEWRRDIKALLSPLDQIKPDAPDINVVIWDCAAREENKENEDEV